MTRTTESVGNTFVETDSSNSVDEVTSIFSYTDSPGSQSPLREVKESPRSRAVVTPVPAAVSIAVAYAAPPTTTQSTSGHAPNKLTHYDGLRGIAALWVFFVHFMPKIDRRLSAALIAYQDWSAAVPLFFILSGRVITASVLRSGKIRQLISAIIRRPFRLLLPMVTMIAIDWIFLGVLAWGNFAEVIVPPFWFLFDSGPVPQRSTGVVWTLSNEYIWSNFIYVLTLLMVQFKDNSRARYIIFGVTFAWFQLTHQWGTHFVAGLFLADLAEHGHIERYRAWKPSMIVTPLVFIGSCLLPFRFSFWTFPNTIDEAIRSVLFHHGRMGVTKQFWEENFVIFVFSFAVMFSIETTGWLQRFFARRPFVFLGNVSFTLYLSHMYTVGAVLNPLYKWLDAVFVDKTIMSAVMFVVSTSTVLFVAYLLTPIVDLPSATFGKWIERVVFEDPWSWQAFTAWVKALPRVLFGWIISYFISTINPILERFGISQSKLRACVPCDLESCHETHISADKKSHKPLFSRVCTFFDSNFPLTHYSKVPKDIPSIKIDVDGSIVHKKPHFAPAAL